MQPRAQSESELWISSLRQAPAPPVGLVETAAKMSACGPRFAVATHNDSEAHATAVNDGEPLMFVFVHAPAPTVGFLVVST